MKLHWSPKSPFVRKVMIVAHERVLAKQITLVRSVALMTAPNPVLMRDNPLSKIPTLVLENGRALFDSAVICEYLDSLHPGSRLFPESGDARWRALRWQALGDGMLDVLILWRNERERPSEKQQSSWTQAFDLKVRSSLLLLESETDELDTVPFCIGHVAIGCAIGYLDYRFADLSWREASPRLTQWYAGFAQRQSTKITMPLDG